MVAPLIELRDGSEQPFEIPGLCPECGEPVEVTREKEAEVARCINLKCAGQVRWEVLGYWTVTPYPAPSERETREVC